MPQTCQSSGISHRTSHCALPICSFLFHDLSHTHRVVFVTSARSEDPVGLNARGLVALESLGVDPHTDEESLLCNRSHQQGFIAKPGPRLWDRTNLILLDALWGHDGSHRVPTTTSRQRIKAPMQASPCLKTVQSAVLYDSPTIFARTVSTCTPICACPSSKLARSDLQSPRIFPGSLSSEPLFHSPERNPASLRAAGRRKKVVFLLLGPFLEFAHLVLDYT